MQHLKKTQVVLFILVCITCCLIAQARTVQYANRELNETKAWVHQPGQQASYKTRLACMQFTILTKGLLGCHKIVKKKYKIQRQFFLYIFGYLKIQSNNIYFQTKQTYIKILQNNFFCEKLKKLEIILGDTREKNYFIFILFSYHLNI